MSKTALLLVDLQLDFCPGGALAGVGGDETVAVANRLAPHFDIIVATQDCHPRDHKSFAANHPGAKPYQMIELHGLPQVLWPIHCVAGSPGGAFHPALDSACVANIFPKGTDATVDSYSGFFDNGRRRSTGLAEWLRAQGVTDVVVMGLATDYCVKFTTLDAITEGFAATLVVDGCRAVNLAAGDGERAIDAMRQAGATVTDCNALIDAHPR